MPAHSVRDFLEAAPRYAAIDCRAHVGTDARYFRPTKVDSLEGDASKAKRLLNWQPEVTFETLIESMAEHDLEIARQEQTLVLAGYTIAPRGGAHV
jgi:GDPmannose 4,6-dehydratase